MRKRTIAGAALAAVLLCAVPAGASAADPPADLLPVGAKAPLFETVDIDGAPYTFADDLARGPVFLVFWSIFWGSCREELPVLESQKETLEQYGARVISVNLDEPPRAKAVKAFAQQQGFTFAIVMNKTFGKAYEIEKPYQVKGTPTSYLIDGSGLIVDAHYGPVDAEALKASLEKLPAD